MSAGPSPDDTIGRVGVYLRSWSRDELALPAAARLVDQELIAVARQLGDEAVRLSEVPELAELGLLGRLQDVLASARGSQLVGSVAETYAQAMEAHVECGRCGRDSCSGPAECAAISPEAVQQVCRPATMRTASEVMAARPAVEVVESMVAPGRVTLCAAESGAGKTFLVVDLAGAVADGRPWHGRETQLGTVVFLSYEGSLRLRLMAARDASGYTLDDFFEREAAGTLSPRIDREGSETPSHAELVVSDELRSMAAWLEAESRPPIRLLIVDTVRQSLAGSEDSSQDASAYMRAVRRLVAVVPSAGALLVHHAGWQDSPETRRRRERGSSAWRGDVDYSLYLEAGEYDRDTGEAPLTLTWSKVRDGEIPPPLRLIRRRVEVAATDHRGRVLTSCVIVRDTRSKDDVEAERRAAQEVAERETDIRILNAIVEHSPTSLDSLRMLVGARRDLVYASVSRLTAGRLVAHARRGEPYTVTSEGHRLLSASAPSHRPPPSHDRPGDASHDRPTVPPPIGADGTGRESTRGKW